VEEDRTVRFAIAFTFFNVCLSVHYFTSPVHGIPARHTTPPTCILQPPVYSVAYLSLNQGSAELE
jgi:hypothetical protein